MSAGAPRCRRCPSGTVGPDQRCRVCRALWEPVTLLPVVVRFDREAVRALGAERVTDLVCPEEYGP